MSGQTRFCSDLGCQEGGHGEQQVPSPADRGFWGCRPPSSPSASSGPVLPPLGTALCSPVQSGSAHPWVCLGPEPVHTFLCSLTVLGARLSSLGWLRGSPVTCCLTPTPPHHARASLTFSPLLSHPFPPHQNNEPILRPCSHAICRDLDSFTPSHWLFIQQLFTEHLRCAGSRVGLGVPSACVHSWVEWKTEGAVAHDQPLQLAVCG